MRRDFRAFPALQISSGYADLMAMRGGRSKALPGWVGVLHGGTVTMLAKTEVPNDRDPSGLQRGAPDARV